MALSITISNNFNAEVLSYDTENPTDGGEQFFSYLPLGTILTCNVINTTPDQHFDFTDGGVFQGNIENGTTINTNDHPTGFTVRVVGSF